jgi:hypothetical protein
VERRATPLVRQSPAVLSLLARITQHEGLADARNEKIERWRH